MGRQAELTLQRLRESEGSVRPLLVRLPRDLDDALRAWCAEQERPLSWAVRKALRAWLDGMGRL